MRFFIPIALVLAATLLGCGGGGSSGTTITGRMIFITSQTFDGALGGVSGADQKCDFAASAAGLSGTWKAWLSESGVTASTHVGSVFPWSRSDGFVVFENAADRDFGQPQRSPVLDEFGQTVTDALVWTGTDRSGFDRTDHCFSWQSSSPSLNGGQGDAADSGPGRWTDAGLAACNGLRRLLCLQDP